MTDYSKLLELAKAATPGPWYTGCFCDDSSTCNCKTILHEYYAGGIATIHVHNGIRSIADGGNNAPPVEEAKANQRYIAAANPETIIALLSQLAALKARVDGEWNAGVEAAAKLMEDQVGFKIFDELAVQIRALTRKGEGE